MVILITGGAGFIGSHLVDRLLREGHMVRVLDNLSTGSRGNLERWVGDKDFEFRLGDLLNGEDVDVALRGVDTVYHLAANPEVRVASGEQLGGIYRQNIEATFNLLEGIRRIGGVDVFSFASSSTVYGEPEVFPTPESYGPLNPISMYGASKLAGESLVSAYSELCGFRACVFRFGNVIGPRSTHGVVFDFSHKIRENPRFLEVLGDGSQSKSYLFVEDCVEGLLFCSERSVERRGVFNLSAPDRIDVVSIAEIVLEKMGKGDAEVRMTGGVDGGRGWVGDVKIMQLDVAKAVELGWKPRYSSREAVELAAEHYARMP